MEENELIKYEQGQLQRVGNAIAVTNKLLALSEPKLIPYRKKDKWGFCTPDKSILIECIYDDANRFYEELASVKLNEKWGFINKSGDIVIPLIYDDFNGGFSDGLASVKLDEKWGFINKSGDIVIPLIYDYDESFFSEGLA